MFKDFQGVYGSYIFQGWIVCTFGCAEIGSSKILATSISVVWTYTVFFTSIAKEVKENVLDLRKVSQS